MALLAAQQIPVTGLAPTYGAVAASDTVTPQGIQILHVKNAGGSADTCVVVIPGTLYGQPITDVSVTVPATTGDRLILLTPDMQDPTTGLITVTHSFTTSVTCALFRL